MDEFKIRLREITSNLNDLINLKLKQINDNNHNYYKVIHDIEVEMKN